MRRQIGVTQARRWFAEELRVTAPIRRNEAVVDASGLAVESLADEWPQFRHPARPEFLLTTPHRHQTTGFFIARLRKW